MTGQSTKANFLFRARVVEQPSQYFQPPTSELTFPEPSRLLSPPHRAANTIYSHAAAESILPETTAFASLSDEGDSTFSRTLDRFITDLDY